MFVFVNVIDGDEYVVTDDLEDIVCKSLDCLFLSFL